jgi:hypothetical protein
MREQVMRDDCPVPAALMEDESETHRRDDFVSILDIARSVVIRVDRGIAVHPDVLFADGHAQIGASRRGVGEIFNTASGAVRMVREIVPQNTESSAQSAAIRCAQSLQVFYFPSAIIYAGFTPAALICRDRNRRTGQCALKDTAGGLRLPGLP